MAGVASAYAANMSALTSSESQLATAANTGYPIKLTGDPSEAYKIDGSKVIILRAGNYYLNAAAQIGGTTTGDVYLWMRLNGKDVADSNSIQTVPVKGFTAVLVAQTGIGLKKGDVVEFVYAASEPGLGLIAPTPKGMPAVPSIIFPILEL
jgi:hypothetical protein